MSTLARSAGRVEQARALIEEAIRLSASVGDWRLEAIARNGLVDLSWQLGPIDEAAGLVRKLAEELRARPAADIDMDLVFGNLMGILSEMGRIDEASAAARELLPILRRTRRNVLEEWVHLFWRRGQVDIGTLLLGASDAEQARLGTPHQDNEQRLIAQARAGLEAAQDPHSFASGLAAGAVLAERDLLDVVAKALTQSSANEATSSSAAGVTRRAPWPQPAPDAPA